jgi:DNA-binding response OmpR family regulator
VPPKVLIVDDDLDVREALADGFHLLCGVECVLAGSLKELQEERGASAAFACRLAIVDINLGAGQPSGVDVARWLRSREFAGKIVFLTGHGLGDPRVMAAAEVTDTQILSKPIRLDVLSRLLDEGRP